MSTRLAPLSTPIVSQSVSQSVGVCGEIARLPRGQRHRQHETPPSIAPQRHVAGARGCYLPLLSLSISTGGMSMCVSVYVGDIICARCAQYMLKKGGCGGRMARVYFSFWRNKMLCSYWNLHIHLRDRSQGAHTYGVQCATTGVNWTHATECLVPSSLRFTSCLFFYCSLWFHSRGEELQRHGWGVMDGVFVPRGAVRRRVSQRRCDLLLPPPTCCCTLFFFVQ